METVFNCLVDSTFYNGLIYFKYKETLNWVFLKAKKKEEEFHHRCHMCGMVNNGEWWRGPKCHVAAL